ncbi:peptidyl-prolyl cis-trans isomerase [Helicobacter aurati]|uniref:Peptidyl-prolyl cis-trans isomerase n=2 Tax=Helicobacter aurati TaxID=137778 RepID=A0A3D8J495_9HELI|nr:peptidyl-prolyl cis-trans isomerase [Helicobacter aurati]
MQIDSPKHTISYKKRNIVDGIALFVNGEPITLYAISQAEKMLNTDKLRATDFLIMEELRKEEIKRLKIEVTDAQIDSQINQIAEQNNMNLNQFYAAVVKEGMSLSEYRAKLKEQMLMQDLMRKILFSSNIGQEDELRKYYNEHSEEFLIPKRVQSIKFVSKDKQSLESFIRSGLSSPLPSNIAKGEEELELESLPHQIADVFLTTSQNTFTPVLESGEGSYVAFFVKNKLDITHVDFEKAKGYIVQKLMMTNQEKILAEYFERVRTRSKIVFIR